MPKNAELSKDEEARMESGGGLSKNTEEQRETVYAQFISWLDEKGYDDISAIEASKLEQLVPTYFFTLRVTPLKVGN